MRFKHLFIVFILGACDPGVDVESMSARKLISVTCIISPQDTVFTAYLYHGSPIGSTISKDSAAVKDALVTISDGTKYDTLNLHSEIDPDTNKKGYKYVGRRKNLTVKTGFSYHLSVTTSDGVSLEASCVIPAMPSNVSVEGQRVDDDYHFSVKWKNNSTDPYFILVMEALGSYPSSQGGEIDLKPSLDEAVEFPSARQVVENEYEGSVPFAYKAADPALRVTVQNIDESIYNYFDTYRQYDRWQSNNSGSLLPNFKEVPILYSNIKGGVGVFGGYNQVTVISKP